MGNQDYTRLMFGPVLRDKFLGGKRRFDIQGRRGLVEDEIVVRPYEHAGKRHACCLSTRQALGRFILQIRNPQSFHELSGSLQRNALSHITSSTHHDVVQKTPVEGVAALRHETNRSRAEIYLSPIGFHDPRDDLRERRLPTAVGADDGMNAVRGELVLFDIQDEFAII